MFGWRLVVLVLILSALVGCGRHGPSVNSPIKPGPRSIDEVTVAERRSMLDRAEVWQPVNPARLDLLAGPDGDGAFEFGAHVTCSFDYPDKPAGGATPKFDCALTPKDVVKVKYGLDNGEVFAEVAASRLFWALGFFADRMYPVKVTCLDCPSDPFRASAVDWGLGRPGNVGRRTYEFAAIERKFGGKDIEVPPFEGWSWRELEDIADNAAGASRAHIDALKLLAAFIQHVDSKPGNQALVCPKGEVTLNGQGNETCENPMLVVKDLGSSFAAASRMRFVKMNLGSWRSVRIWRDERACRAELTSSFVGTLGHPLISEPGRKFLAERLSLLSDRQIEDLFTASRVERRHEMLDGRRVTVADWVEVFKAKRDQIVNHRCDRSTDNR